MSNEPLARYLSDHYAGSIGAIELLKSLSSSRLTADWTEFFQQLLEDVQFDQHELLSIAKRFETEPSRMSNGIAWIGEKVSEARLHPSKLVELSWELLEALEILYLGISGKEGLWRALIACNFDYALDKNANLVELRKRATSQKQSVDERRLTVAKQIFSGEV